MDITLFIDFKTNCCPYVSITFPKGDVCADKEPRDKKLGKVTSFLETVQVLGKSDRGMKTAAVRCLYEVNKLMIYLIN
jgi:hypothetical protein